MDKKYILTFDVGTTNIKSVLFLLAGNKKVPVYEISKSITLIVEKNKAEQDPDEWWQVIKDITKEILEVKNVESSLVVAISFCCQMLALVLSDNKGRPVRKAMNYMDSRCEKINFFKEWPAIISDAVKTGVAPVDSKDNIYKYQWVKKHEPEVFERLHKWMDVEDYLSMKCTDNFLMGEDSAFVTFLYNIKNKRWQTSLFKHYELNKEHLCDVLSPSLPRGVLTNESAEELELCEGIPVFAAGDISCIAIGSLAKDLNMTHVYWGTSGWVSTAVDKLYVDFTSGQASVVGAVDNFYNYIGQTETAGKCLDWILSILDKDYSYLDDLYDNTNPGANGVLFAPWINGERCPFTDSSVKSSFSGIGLETTSKDLVRAVIEGICLEFLWIYELQKTKFKFNDDKIIYFCGGGATNPCICQILSDVIGVKVLVRNNPEFAGVMGACDIACKSLGHEGIDLIDNEDGKIYTPNMDNHKKYKDLLSSFKKLRRIKR